MKLVLVSVRDDAVGAFMRPFFCQSEGQAIRSFFDECRRESPDNVMHTHREDMKLYFLGSWHDDTGLVTPAEPFVIARGIDYPAVLG